MRNGGPSPGTAAADQIAATAKSQHREHTAAGAPPVFAWATAYAPSPGRRLWVYSVPCPAGHGTHLHRAGPPRPEGYLRTARCGQSYLILARTVAGRWAA